MSIPRPLTKPVLKKMYLKALYEIKTPKGRFKDHGWAIGAVISLFQHVFQISDLTPAERQLAFRAVYELERDGFLQQDVGQGSEHKIFMERGLKAAEQAFEEINIGWIDIDELLSHEALKSKVRDDYVEGDFESCVFKAFRLLEETVRNKASQPASMLGTSLMAAAFRNGGVLKHPDAQVEPETEGIHALMRGAIGWLKNPASHRTVSHCDPQRTAQILAFADYLLTLTDEATA